MKPTAILCADLHFRDSQPSCRIDDFFIEQVRVMTWLKKLQAKYDCPVWCSGDYFHHWKPSPALLSACIKYMPYVYTIPGNHDLPNHNTNLLEKSGLHTLEAAGKVAVMPTELEKPYSIKLDDCKCEVAFIHKLINHPQSGTTAKALMKKLKGYDLILTGDNHEHFIVEKSSQLLVNPGSITRQTAAQIDHKPCVVLWWAETNEYEEVYLPIKNDVISREHLEKDEERDERIEAFVSSLKGGYEVELSFENNLVSFFKDNKVNKSVKQLVWEAMDE